MGAGIEHLVAITGATGGIGRAAAQRLASEGRALVVHGFTAAKLPLLKEELQDLGAPYVKTVTADLLHANEGPALMVASAINEGIVDTKPHQFTILFNYGLFAWDQDIWGPGVPQSYSVNGLRYDQHEKRDFQWANADHLPIITNALYRKPGIVGLNSSVGRLLDYGGPSLADVRDDQKRRRQSFAEVLPPTERSSHAYADVKRRAEKKIVSLYSHNGKLLSHVAILSVGNTATEGASIISLPEHLKLSVPEAGNALAAIASIDASKKPCLHARIMVKLDVPIRNIITSPSFVASDSIQFPYTRAHSSDELYNNFHRARRSAFRSLLRNYAPSAHVL